MMKRIILGTLALTLLTACSKDDGQQALGTLERDRVTFTATSSEIIRALPIKEGSQVTEGEVLVQLDTKNQEAVLAHAVAEQAKADAYLLKLTNGERPEDIAAAQARVARAEAQLVEAQKNYQRKAELVRKKTHQPIRKRYCFSSQRFCPCRARLLTRRVQQTDCWLSP